MKTIKILGVFFCLYSQAPEVRVKSGITGDPLCTIELKTEDWNNLSAIQCREILNTVLMRNSLLTDPESRLTDYWFGTSANLPTAERDNQVINAILVKNSKFSIETVLIIEGRWHVTVRSQSDKGSISLELCIETEENLDKLLELQGELELDDSPKECSESFILSLASETFRKLKSILVIDSITCSEYDLPVYSTSKTWIKNLAFSHIDGRYVSALLRFKNLLGREFFELISSFHNNEDLMEQIYAIDSINMPDLGIAFSLLILKMTGHTLESSGIRNDMSLFRITLESVELMNRLKLNQKIMYPPFAYPEGTSEMSEEEGAEALWQALHKWYNIAPKSTEAAPVTP